MSKEKQIEEMAKAICEHYVKNGCGRCPDCSCEGDALKLYNAGYRKQIEAEWIPHRFDKNGRPISWYCSNCRGIGDNSSYCSHCGAKMKGCE